MIVAGALFAPAFSNRALKALGDASYSLYLTHVVTLAAIGQMWVGGLQRLGAPLFVISALTSCVLAASLCYRFLERPITAALKKFWPPSTKRSSGRLISSKSIYIWVDATASFWPAA